MADMQDDISREQREDAKSLPFVPCPRCGDNSLLRLKQVGWYFVQCYNCNNFNDSVVGKTAPAKEDAISNWQSGVLDERFWQPEDEETVNIYDAACAKVHKAVWDKVEEGLG